MNNVTKAPKNEMIKLTDEQFAKVYQIGPRQILIYWTKDDEKDDQYLLNQIIKTNHGEANLKICHPKKSVIKKMFDGYNQIKAEKCFAMMKDNIACFAKGLK